MKKLFTFVLMLFAIVSLQAKSFKVGPASSSDTMDFASINEAMSSANIAAGDTLWLDKNYSAGESDAQTVTKAVVIIGTGYDTTQTTEGVVATVYLINLNTENIVLRSIYCSSTICFNSANCLIDRCRVGAVNAASSTGANEVRSSYITGSVLGNSTDKSIVNMYNNVLNNAYISYIKNSDLEYNTIYYNSASKSSYQYCIQNVDGCKIRNNIIWSIYSGTTVYYNRTITNQVDCSVDHNVFSAASSSTTTTAIYFAGSNFYNSVFINKGSYSDYFTVNNSNIKTFATDGGEVGCHGGMFGNPDGGRPEYVPYFSNIVVDSKSKNGKLNVSLTVKVPNE